MSDNHPLFENDFKVKKEFFEIKENTKNNTVKNIYSSKQNKHNIINQYSFYFHDVECDPIDCNISVDGLKIDTDDYKHILLDQCTIYRMYELLQEFESDWINGEKNIKI